MYLTELTDLHSGQPDPEIKGMTSDSRAVKPGWLFAALPGSRVDGRRFINDALEAGAVAVLAPPGTDMLAKKGVALFTDPNPRRQLAKMAARFYKEQPDFIAAVTGTNGKTSVVDFTRQIWTMLGYHAASLGTLGIKAAGEYKPGALTTPDPVSLHAELADLAGDGIDHLAMEASSHGLDQSRLDGVKASAAGFTNISHDHLDYHESFEKYFSAKTRLFSDILQPGGVAVLNADVPEFKKLAALTEKRGGQVLGYGHNGKYLKLTGLKPSSHGQEIELMLLGKAHRFTIPLAGAFQVMNILCATGLVMAEAPEDEELAEKVVSCLPRLKGVPGRLGLVPEPPEWDGKGAVYIDYAHTPDALENILRALRPHTAGRLICLFGCGGDRDKAKRPVMGEIAAELADLAIVTDDNPRSEDPAKIRAEIMAAAPGATEIDGRREAIIWAIEQLDKGDVLVIAGKGHETGQIIGDRTEPFDDLNEAKRAMGRTR